MSDQSLTSFLRVMPLPLVWDPVKHLQALKDGLNNPQCPHYCFIEGMRPNLKAVIEAYETGKMSNKGTQYFKGGKMVPKAEADIIDDFVQTEHVGHFEYQRANPEVYGSLPGAPEDHHTSNIQGTIRYIQVGRDTLLLELPVEIWRCC